MAKKTTTPQRLKKVFNVKHYGAKGDKITDDTAAIQRAIDAAHKAGGRVFLPTGEYKLTSPVLLKKKSRTR